MNRLRATQLVVCGAQAMRLGQVRCARRKLNVLGALLLGMRIGNLTRVQTKMMIYLDTDF